MKYLLNEELSRMQVLAGLVKPKHDFEIFLEKYNHLSVGEMVNLLLEADNEEIGKIK